MKKFEITYEEYDWINFCIFITYINGHLSKDESNTLKKLLDKIKENRLKPNKLLICEIDELPF